MTYPDFIYPETTDPASQITSYLTLKFLLNINFGIIHNSDNPCYQRIIMSECNKRSWRI